MRLIITLLFMLLPVLTEGAESLRLVTSLDPLEAEEYIKEFEKDTGIDVQWIRLSAGEVIARLKAEEGNETQSVWFGAPLPEFSAAKEAGLLKPYRPKDVSQLPAKWNDPNGHFTAIYFGAIGFVSNKKFLEKNGLAPPDSWNAILDEKWRNRITLAYPYTAGTGYTILAGLISLMGEDEAFEYYEKLDRLVHHYTKSGASPIIEVGLGEAGAGLVFAQDAIRKGVMRGFPVVISFPKEGAPFEVGAVALIKGSMDARTAKEFMDWIISLKAQDLFHKFGRTPIHPKAKAPADVPQNIKFIDMDLIELGKKKGDYIVKWRRVMRQ